MQMRWRPGARWWSLQCSPDPIAGLGEGDGVREAELEMEGLEGKGRGGRGKGGKGGKGSGPDQVREEIDTSDCMVQKAVYYNRS